MKKSAIIISFIIILLSITLNIQAGNGTFVVVIDPGHGGHDIGAPGVKTNEKSINLAVALKLGKLIEQNYSDVKVVYTRKTDKFKLGKHKRTQFSVPQMRMCLRSFLHYIKRQNSEWTKKRRLKKVQKLQAEVAFDKARLHLGKSYKTQIYFLTI